MNKNILILILSFFLSNGHAALLSESNDQPEREIDKNLFSELYKIKPPYQENANKIFKKNVLWAIKEVEKTYPNIKQLVSYTPIKLKYLKVKSDYSISSFSFNIPDGYLLSRSTQPYSIFYKDDTKISVIATKGIEVTTNNAELFHKTPEGQLFITNLIRKNIPYMYYPVSVMPSWIEYLGYKTSWEHVKKEINPVYAWQLLAAIVERCKMPFVLINPYAIYDRDDLFAVAFLKSSNNGSYTAFVKISMLPKEPTMDVPSDLIIKLNTPNKNGMVFLLNDFAIPVIKTINYHDRIK